MSNNGNKAGVGFKTFRCAKCGALVTRRKSLALPRTGGKYSDAAERSCRDTDACKHRVISNKNKKAQEFDVKHA